MGICTCIDTPRIWRKQPRSASQDEDIGRNTSLPHTTKRRTTANLKTKNNQNCQIFKLHGSPTTKELKKTFIQTGRRGGDGQRRRRGHTAKEVAGGPVGPTFVG